MRRFDLQNVAVARPHLEGAPDRAVGADGLGLLGALGAHLRLHLRERKNRSIAYWRLNPLDDIDHVAQRIRRGVGQVARLSEHRLLHQSIARTHRDAMTAGDTTRTIDLRAAVPQHARMFALPIDRKCLIHLNVLARFNTTPTQNALVWVVAVERIRHVLLIGLRHIRPRLVLYVEFCGRVVDRAIAIVVVAHGAVQHVVLQNAVERLALRDVDSLACCFHLHPRSHAGRTRPHQFAIHLYHARIAALDRPHLLDIADLWHSLLCIHRSAAIQQIDQQLTRVAWNLQSVDCHLGIRGVVSGSIQKGFRDGHDLVRCRVAWQMLVSATYFISSTLHPTCGDRVLTKKCTQKAVWSHLIGTIQDLVTRKEYSYNSFAALTLERT